MHQNCVRAKIARRITLVGLEQDRTALMAYLETYSGIERRDVLP